jgi:hypothetical protein
MSDDEGYYDDVIGDIESDDDAPPYLPSDSDEEVNFDEAPLLEAYGRYKISNCMKIII